MDKLKIQRCRELVAAIYGGTAQRKDEVELCELLPEALDAADQIDLEVAFTEADDWVKRKFPSIESSPELRSLVVATYAAGAVRSGKR